VTKGNRTMATKTARKPARKPAGKPQPQPQPQGLDLLATLNPFATL
jgi:hypothetical protein